MYREKIDAGLSRETVTGITSDRVLIVIPCLNECKHIAALLAYVLDNTAELDCLTVIADGGSTDGTADVLTEAAARSPGIKVIFNPKRIQSAGVNLAVRAFGEGRRWLIRLDAHAQYPAGYLKILIAEAKRTAAASVVVAMTSQGSGCFQSAVAAVQNSTLGAGGAAHRRAGKAQFVDHGHHALFDLQRFTAVGGYDERVTHNEDAEFDVRLTRAGGKIWLTRAVEVVYFPRATVQALYRQYVSYGRGRAATLVRHRKIPKLRQMVPAAVAPAIAILCLTPWYPVAGIPALFWALLSMLYGAGLGARRGLRGAFFAGVAAITIHTAWSVGFWREILVWLRHPNSDSFVAAVTASDAAS
jgi:succinoglycan biosynthesis protein ExoA